ncbi:DNA primase [bacterium]|nr:DNA primase [bacterium]
MSRGRIPEEVLEEIRERVSIERIIGDYVPLKRAGRHFKGHCPFHQEKTPSFTVNTDLQIFKCFGCGESGNVFTFLMKYESISFIEAVERLAQQTGIELPNLPHDSETKRSENDNLRSVMKQAWKKYHEFLLQSPKAEIARKYFTKRGYNFDLIKKYGLGYAPDQWDYIINQLNVPVEILQRAGLVVKKESSSRYYDRFRNRVMFPIREHRRGEIVAFGGRTLGDDPAKYINSPDSAIYNKSKVLYGLYDARQEIRKSREVFLVEGYFDRLALDKSGMLNSVAPCGTSVTEAQIKLLKRSVQTIYMLFDADQAGIIAAKRALEICLGSGLETLAIPLPANQDPDDVINEHGVEGIQSLISKALPALDFLIASATERHDILHSRGRRQVVEEMLPFLIDVENSIDRGAYIARIADLVRVPSESVMELLRRHRKRRVRKSRDRSYNDIDNKDCNISTTLDLKERNLFYFFIQNPEYVLWEGNSLTADAMLTKQGKSIYQLLENDLLNEGGSYSLSRIIDKVQNENIKNTIIELFDDPSISRRLIEKDPAVIFQEIIRSFQIVVLQAELIQIKQQLKSQGISDEDAENLLKKQSEILDILNHNMMS